MNIKRLLCLIIGHKPKTQHFFGVVETAEYCERCDKIIEPLRNITWEVCLPKTKGKRNLKSCGC